MIDLLALKRRAGALVYDLPRFLRTVKPRSWIEMRNRDEQTTTDGRGVACHWEFTSDLHIAKMFSSAGRRVMRVALHDWPIVLSDVAPAASASPEVTFVIGHRGVDRLPHLLATLRSIAASEGASIECIVVEQSAVREIESKLPAWVRYVHTPVARDYPYNRAWTLNVGAKLARAPIVVLHDNDMLVPQRYAAEVVARVGEGARFLDLKRFTFYLSPEESARLFDGAAVRPADATIVQNARGASIAAVRDAYFEIGGFDEEFVGWGGEDNDFWERAEAAGGINAFGYLPFVHLFHAPQPGKLQGNAAPAVTRYHELRNVPARERIARLRGREIGRVDQPFVAS